MRWSSTPSRCSLTTELVAGGVPHRERGFALLVGGGAIAVFACWQGASGNWGIAVVALTVALAGAAVLGRWDLAPLWALGLSALLPYSLWAILTGGTDGAVLSRLHPATIYALALVGLGWRPGPGWRQLISRPDRRLALVLQLLFIAAAAGMSIASRGLRGLPVLADNYIGPVLVFWMCLGIFDTRAESRQRAGTWIGFIGAILAIAAVAELVARRNPIYEPTYGDVPWFPFATGQYRATITFGAPLAASNGLLFALAVVGVVPRFRLRLLLSSILLVGVLATGSRSATAMAVLLYPLVYIAWGEVHEVSGGLWSARSLRVVLAATGVLGVALVSPIGRKVVQRTLTSWESTAVRVVSAEYFADHLSDYATKGVGLGGSTDVSTAVFGSYITFENPWIMLAVDVGIPLMLLFFVTFLGSLRAAMARPIPWFSLAGVLAITTFESGYNSFGVRSIAAYLLWTSLAFLGRSSVRYRAPTEA